MLSFDNNNIIECIFLRELKNRFLCEVLIDDEVHECYVPSSSRLENYLNLKDKKVLIEQKINSKTRTQLSLLAVKHKQDYILLNLSYVNQLIKSEMNSRRFSSLGKRNLILREKNIDNYKADIFIDTHPPTIIEIKALLAISKQATFPDVYSDRAVRQLQQIAVLLDKGYKVTLMIIALNPYIESVTISKRNLSFYDALSACMQKGLITLGFSCTFKDTKLRLKKRINVNI